MTRVLSEIFGECNFGGKRYNVKRWTGFSPNMYKKVEWAKEVIRIWKVNLQYDMRTPYPPMPPERHFSKEAQRARSRGGKARAAAIRRRKRGQKGKTKKGQSAAAKPAANDQ